MFSSPARLLAVLVSASLFSSAYSLIISNGTMGPSICLDSSCNNCTNQYSRATDVAPYPACVIHPASDLVGYSGPPGGQGVNAFINVPQPDPGCAFIVRRPAAKASMACGIVSMYLENGGCFATNIQHKFMFQYCCGPGDCGSDFAPGSKRRSIDFTSDGLRDPIPEVRSTVPTTAVSAPRHSRDFPSLTKRDDFACVGTLTKVGDSVQSEGAQIRIGSDIDCAGSNAACSQSASTTTTQSYTYTISTTVGVSVTVGVPLVADFTASLSVTAGFSYDTSSATTLASTLTIPPGARGVLTWTPFLNCGVINVSGCNKGVSNGSVLSSCSPILDGTGAATGEYSVVTTG